MRDCTFYAKGRCTKGDKCTFSHANQTLLAEFTTASIQNSTTSAPSISSTSPIPRPQTHPTRPCAFYLNEKGCKFGDSCTFIHDSSSTSDAKVQLGNIHNGKDTMEKSLEQLKLLFRAFSRSRHFVGIHVFEDFLRLSLRLLESGNREIQTKVVEALTEMENGGLIVIHYCAEQIGCRGDVFQNIDFDKHIIPSVKIIT